MKLFVFLLMMVVAAGGILGGYRLITGEDLVSLSDLGIGGTTSGAAALPSPVPSPTATAAPTAVVIPTPVPPTPAPQKVQIMIVANTDSVGVYVRRTPKLDDRLRAWVEGTKMEVSGDPVDGDGQKWLKVRAPDGSEGYVPMQYLAPAP